MNILLHTAIALQATPRMVESLIKMGAFLGGSTRKEQHNCSKLAIDKILLFEQFERFIPSFFNPDLKLFLLTILWDESGKISVFPKGKTAEPFQFIFGKKNSRKLKTNKIDLLEKPTQGTVNLVAWGMEIKAGHCFGDIDHQEVTKLIENSTFNQLLAKAARRKEQLNTSALSLELLKLQQIIPQKAPFIAALHPILQFSSCGSRLYSRKNKYGEACIKVEY